jgi:hypothetical protein
VSGSNYVIFFLNFFRTTYNYLRMYHQYMDPA